MTDSELEKLANEYEPPDIDDEITRCRYCGNPTPRNGWDYCDDECREDHEIERGLEQLAGGF